MSWIGVVTNAGASILAQWISGGHTLTITGATVGSGYVAEANMRTATALSAYQADGAIVSASEVTGGTQFRIRVLPAASTAYTAHEIGIWGHLDSDATDTLIALHQDSGTGVPVPTAAEMPSFLFDMFCVHAITNDGTLTIEISEQVYATQDDLTTAVTSIDATLNSHATMLDNILGDFATIEDDPIAVNTYEAGEYLINNNLLYKTIDDIAVGDDLEVGVNIEQTTVGSEVAALNSNLTQYYYQTGLRFKNLGSSFTTAQATALANGDFSDFWNGDYWTINGVNWRIVDNTGIARRRGDIKFDTNSLIIMPDTNLVSAAAFLVDSANDSGHGYSNSGYRSSYRSTCKSTIASAFGSSHIASHRELMSNARGSAGATGWAWTDADVELPSEFNIYGGSSFGASSLGGAGGYNVGSQWGQFALFRLAPYMAINRSINYWLRDIVNASNFASVVYNGNANCYAPSHTDVGLRPFFILV